MLTFKNLTIKNFLSVGNVTQAVTFDHDGITLILGNNLDLGGDGNRNGTGKTVLVNALCYGLYGQAITDIKKENLINKSNAKNMLVTIDFEKNGQSFKIERGRRPNVFRFLVNGTEVGDQPTDDAQGESKLTQLHVDQVLGLSCDMFRHIVALNTHTTPFLGLKSADQREIIEQLLGITQLSEKAAVLAKMSKAVRDDLKEQEVTLKAQQDANVKIQASITDLTRRSKVWTQGRDTDIDKMQASIASLEAVNIDVELLMHKDLQSWKESSARLLRLSKELIVEQAAQAKIEQQLIDITSALSSTEDHVCHACGQGVHDTAQESMLTELRGLVVGIKEDLSSASNRVSALEVKIDDLRGIGPEPIVHYDTIDDAINHKTTIEGLYRQLEDKLLETDPYHEQAVHLQTSALAVISWDKINETSKLLEHHDFLFKLLTNKDSFIRKRIIEQNLGYLNHRLSYYLEKLFLPHEVKFQSDLGVAITQLGQDFDFDSLSRGERNRLIMGLSWAFRDVFESLNYPINLTVLDEVVDSGMDASGVDSALGVLKHMSREQGKSIFLISHRDELVSRVNTILRVTKENGFSTFDVDTEVNEI